MSETFRKPSYALKKRSEHRAFGGLKSLGLLITRWILPVATVLLMAWFSWQTPVFFTTDNLLSIATQNAPTFIVASIFAMLMMAGYVDLSVGSVLALVGVSAGLALNQWGVVPGILIGLAVGIAAGLLNGVLIGLLSFSPIVVTLGGLAAARGLAQYLGQGSIYGFPDAFANFGSNSMLGLPNLVIVALLICLISVIATTCFPIGRQIIAIGVNARAAFLIGIRVRLVVTLLYTLTGLAVGIAGLLQIARLDSAPSGTLGDGFEVIILTAVLLGGVPFTGGKGTIWRVLVGVWLIGTLRNGLILLNIGTELSGIITGGVLVMAAALEAVRYYIHSSK